MTKKIITYFGTAFLISCSSGVETTSEADNTIGQLNRTEKQSENLYTRTNLDSLSNISYPDFDVHEAYQHKNYKLLFGAYTSQPGQMSPHDSESDFGLRLIVLDQSDKLIFRSQGQADSYIQRPKFYRLDDRSPILALVETGTEYSWGNTVYSLDENGIKEVGVINLAGINTEHDEYDDVSKVTRIEKDGPNLKFRFDADSVIVDPGGMNEQVVAAKGYHYIYNGKDFKLVQK